MRVRHDRLRHARFRRTATGATLVALLGGVSVAGTAGPASAWDGTAAPRANAVSVPPEIVVDGVHRRVFVNDATSGNITVSDYAGRWVGRVHGTADVSGLALSKDSKTLYATLSSADTIVAIDTATLKETARYSTGAGTAPLDLVVAGGKIWFSYGTTATGGNLGSLDLSGAAPVVVLDQAGGVRWKTAPQLSVAPGKGDADTVVAGSQFEYRVPTEIAVYEVASGTAHKRVHREDARVPLAVEDIAVTADGTEVMLAGGNYDSLPTLFTSNLFRNDGSKASRDFSGIKGRTNAVETAPGGAVAVGVDHSDDSDVYVFRLGESAPIRIDGFGELKDLAPRGLAWAPDGSKLFALVSGLGDDHLGRVRVIDEPTKSASRLGVTAPAKAPLDKKLTLRGTIGSALALPWSVPVQITRTDAASPKGKSLGTRTVTPDYDGAFTVQDTPPVGGKVTYTLRYAGDATHTAVTASVSVDVPRNKTTLTLDGDGKTFAYGKNATLVAQLGKTWKERTVSLYAQPAGGAKKLLRTSKVDSKGRIAVTYKITKNTKFSAVFPGDARTAPAQDTSAVKVRR
ncbi:YncE family protein [Streptomyces sp. NPDC050504]|uniref:YncE family protein n=1 Tax=Streptomyces sp. NPDC050504 TaxID=3365618 RepID=UPI00379F4638